MDKNMKKIGRQMSVLMGVSLSLCLSLVGNAASGHFTLPGFAVSFAASTVVSLAIGFCVPVKRLGDAACVRARARQGTLAARALESLVSDVLYTPLITFLMVTLAWRQAVAHGAPLPFAAMLRTAFPHSLALCMVVGYALIFVLMPLYLRLVFRMNGIPALPPHGRAPAPGADSTGADAPRA